MKTRLVLLLPLLSIASSADTIRLRNGTEYEGVVLREEGDDYVVSVQVTKSIRDERRIPKRDVLEIVAEKKDEVAFERIKSLVPTPDLLTLEDYVERVNAVEGFMSKFNKSSYLREADKMLKVLDEERKIVADGGMKFEGKMIDGDERAASAYPLDARIAASEVKEFGDAGDLLGALRAWETFEKEFSGSSAYREMIPYAQRVMRTQLSKVNQLLDTFDARVAERESGLERIPQKDRARSEAAIAAEAANYERLVEAEKKAGIKWPSLSPWHKSPLQATKSRLEQEIKRLQKVDPSSIPDAEAAWKEAWDVMNGSPDSSAASSALSAARSARLPERYIEMLEKKAPSK
jgi:hypothetical protein